MNSTVISAVDPTLLPISELAALIKARKLSAVELTRAYLKRIRTCDAQVNAFITITDELALEQAARADREIAEGRYRGALHGIPFAVKDVIDTAGVLTTAHSRILERNFPSADATAVGKLYDAGAILLGKVSTHEFAHGGPSFDLPWPPARNPWNNEHHSGGSSSGSGAAVAAGFAAMALGTDTGGSIRTPSSLCGIVGLKPTYGRVSRYGVINNSFTFDNCGPMTWTVEDCAVMLQAIAGYDPKDPSSSDVPVPDYRATLTPDLKGMRIGVLRHFWEEDLPVSAELARAIENAISTLEKLGATLEVVRMRPIQEYYDVKIVIAESELLAVHQDDFVERPEDFGEIFLGRVLGAALFQSVDYVQAQRERRKMLAEMKPLYERFDAFVTAGLGPAPRLDEHRNIGFWEKWQKPNMTTPFNVTAGPALVQCIGFSEQGLPLSMQVASRPFNEQAVFRVAHAYEKATPWRERRPKLVPGAIARPIAPEPIPTNPAGIEPRTRELVRMMAEQAGLKLPERLLVQMCEAAPYARAMANRIRRKRKRADEPANTFRFPDIP
ncbi:MAG TPA: amidase [Burkholderiales bacterium]|nr:amidase [Burkholderiales bacterium]